MTDVEHEQGNVSPAATAASSNDQAEPKIAAKRRYLFGDYTFYPARQELRFKGAVCHLESKMLQLLAILIEARPSLVSKQELMERLWPDTVVSEWSLARLVSDTRKLLEDSGKQQQFIKTVRGQGFSFTADVDEIIQAYDEVKQASFSSNSQKVQATNGRYFWWIGISAFAVLVLGISWFVNQNNYSVDPLNSTHENLVETHNLIHVMQEVQRNLQLTKTTFIAQARRRNELGELLQAKEQKTSELSWEQRLRLHYPTMDEHERFIFDQIRAMTEGPLHEGNRNIVELLEQYPALYQELPLFNQLHAHLKIWLNKYDKIFRDREDMALVYVGVEDGVPFPKEIDQQVSAWLSAQSTKNE